MKRFFRLLAAILTLAVLAGCGSLSYEELYTLPRASEDYYDLQEALNRILARGLNYAAPAAGARREPVQLVDLTGDGVDEAVCFFRAGDTGAVTIYILSQQDNAYEPAAVIEGTGSAVASVEYADLDGQADLELILTYQVSESVTQALQVYRYTDAGGVNMLSASCSRYELTDLDGDGRTELVCITADGQESPAILECYDCQPGELRRVGEQRLRFPYDSLRQMKVGRLAGNTGALLFSGVQGDGQLLTDVFVLAAEGLLQVQPEMQILTSQPVHSYYVYPEDLNGDGIMEIPQTRQLPAYDSGSAAQSVVDWYQITAEGAAEKLCTNYHSFSENWYLELLEAWQEDLIIKAGDESTMVSTVALYQGRGVETPQEILTIYTLRGADRQGYAEEHSLRILYSEGETIYAVSLAAAELWEGTATLSQVSELFHYTGSSQTAGNNQRN